MYSMKNNYFSSNKNSSHIKIRISIPNKKELTQIHKTNIILIQNEDKNQYEVIKDIIHNHRENNSVILDLYTGFGKTIIGLYLASYFKKTLVIISYNVLYEQWMMKIKEFNIDYVDVVKLITEHNKPFTQLIKEYDMIILDECHHEFRRSKELIERYEIEQLIGLSATPLKDERIDQLFKKIISIPLVHRKYIVQPIKLNFKCTLKKNKRGEIDYTLAMSELINNQNRLNKIVKFINERLHLKSLILVKNISTVEYLKTHLNTEDISTFKGNMKNLDLEKQIVIGTYPKMGVGLDTNCFKALYLLDNKKDIIQAEGRCRNNDIIIFEFIDCDHIFLKHFYEHLAFYNKREATILKNIYL